MAMNVLQECHCLAILATAGLLDLVLQYTTVSEAQSEDHRPILSETLPGLSVESTGDNTLPGLPIELVANIASNLDSASLHSLRNTTKWLAAAVDYNYTKCHPTRTVCLGAHRLPGFLKQLTMPAIYTHINRLTLTGSGMSATAYKYPAMQTMFFLPNLKRLSLRHMEMNSISLLRTCYSHTTTLRSLSVHNVYIENPCHWEALLFLILVLFKLDTLQAQGLRYTSAFTGFISRINMPIRGRIGGLEGLRGRRQIKQLINDYFHEGHMSSYSMRIDGIVPILCEAGIVLTV